MNEQLRPVRLVGFPLAIHEQAQEHHSDLMREFSLIALGEDNHHDAAVPVRLLELVKQLTQDFGGAANEGDLQRDAALEAGLDSVDLTYRVPPAAAEASRALAAMLDEADDFCRSGDALLTLATPPAVRLFRDWYLQEFISQLGGAEPTPWPDYASAAAQQRS